MSIEVYMMRTPVVESVVDILETHDQKNLIDIVLVMDDVET